MVVALAMQSCREDSDIINVTPPNTTTPQFGMSIQGSVLGTVVDENGEVLEGATVTYGGLTEITDEYGVFQFNDTEMYTGGTYVEVEKDGYFHGSRKFYPTADAVSRVNVKMIPMVEVASFSSTVGDNVTFEGVKIAFGNNSIMNEDGSEYNGNVKVFAKYLDPTLLETLNEMPGDLTAMNADDERVILTSYGMVAVELRDDSGNELQVKTGSTAEITMPVPTDIVGNAPATIPLWHFDEDLGTWIEEGEATLISGEYVGEVSHFSYWNCDDPSIMIHLSGSVFNRGVPVSGVLVKVTLANDNASGSGLTNSQGVFGGFVPKDEVLVIEVFDHCGVLIYTTTVGPFSEDTVLDPFNLTISSLQAIVSGTVTACEGEPSAATYAVIVQDDFTNVIPLEADNTFATNIFYCEEGDEITVGAVDPINQLASANSVFTVEGNVNVGNLELCEESISQHLYAEYGDQVFNYNETASTLDSLIYSTQTLIQNGAPDIVIYAGITLDWDTGSVVEFTLEYQEGNPLKNASLTIPTSGFKAEGEVNIQKVAQGGQEYITATGTLTNVTVTDETLYDESYNPVFFSIAIRL